MRDRQPHRREGSPVTQAMHENTTFHKRGLEPMSPAANPALRKELELSHARHTDFSLSRHCELKIVRLSCGLLSFDILVCRQEWEEPIRTPEPKPSAICFYISWERQAQANGIPYASFERHSYPNTRFLPVSNSVEENSSFPIITSLDRH